MELSVQVNLQEVNLLVSFPSVNLIVQNINRSKDYSITLSHKLCLEIAV